MKFSGRADGLTLQVECETDLRRGAEHLLAALADMHAHGPALQSGSTVLYGWVELRLEGVGDGLRVCEPDFYAGDVEHYVPGAECTLRVLAEQMRLLRAIGCDSQVTLYTDSLVMARGCLAEPLIYMERRAPVRPSDSGWFIGSVERGAPAADELEAVRAYQLVVQRPELMPALALPAGYLATYSGETLEAVMNDRDDRVWPRGAGCSG